MFNLLLSLYNFILCSLVLESVVEVKILLIEIPENRFRMLHVSIKSPSNCRAYKD